MKPSSCLILSPLPFQNYFRPSAGQLYIFKAFAHERRERGGGKVGWRVLSAPDHSHKSSIDRFNVVVPHSFYLPIFFFTFHPFNPLKSARNYLFLFTSAQSTTTKQFFLGSVPCAPKPF